MIYRQSIDPVFLKKINIDVWLLRDEIEYIVLSRLRENPELKDFSDVVNEFTKKSTPNLRLLKTEDDKPEEEEKIEEQVQSLSPENKNQSEETIEEKNSPIKKIDVQARKETEEAEYITQRIPDLDEEKICRGKTFLSEIYMDEILFFSDRQFVEGQSIVIQFNVPEKFILNAEVTYAQSYSLKNRVISKSNLPFRIRASFSFLKPGERTLLRNFLENVEFKRIETAGANAPRSETVQDDNNDDINNEVLSEKGDEKSNMNDQNASDQELGDSEERTQQEDK